jgi:integrase
VALAAAPFFDQEDDMAGKLTARGVETETQQGRHHDADGLYLVVKGRSKSWAFMWRRDGKRHEIGLGSLRTVSLAEARRLAHDKRAIRDAGGDPRTDRPGSLTFGEAADAYIADQSPGWRSPKHRWQWQQTLGPDFCLSIRDKPCAQITTEDVVRVLKPIWLEKHETAARLAQRIVRVLDYARVTEKREDANPARWKGHLEHKLSRRRKLTRGHLRAMPFDQVPAFMAALRDMEGTAAMALEFSILTAARTGEVLRATWDEIDPDNKLWTLAAERMKGRRQHRVPLSPRALAILREMHKARVSPFVFPGWREGRPLSDMAMSAVLRRMGHDDVTVHGFRSSFRDWCGDKAGVPREIAEEALAHQIGTAIERAYRRSDALDRRRKLMDAWARFCERPEPGGKVVPLRA